MAKTKPIGVRFDTTLLSALEEDGIADSPQKALNFLTEFYREYRKNNDFKKLYAESKLFKKTNTVTVKIKPENIAESDVNWRTMMDDYNKTKKI